jgi:hypothetical protein
MQIRLRGPPILDGSSCDRAWTIEYLRERAVAMDLDRQKVLGGVIDREGHCCLHGGLDLDKAAVSGASIVMLRELAEQGEIVRLLSQNFAKVTDEATVEGEAPLWKRPSQVMDDIEKPQDCAWDRHGVPFVALTRIGSHSG